MRRQRDGHPSWDGPQGDDCHCYSYQSLEMPYMSLGRSAYLPLTAWTWISTKTSTGPSGLIPEELGSCQVVDNPAPKLVPVVAEIMSLAADGVCEPVPKEPGVREFSSDGPTGRQQCRQHG